MTGTINSRRAFLKRSAGASAGLMLGWHMPWARSAPKLDPAQAAINAWLRIAPDDTVTIFVAHAEMGQGLFTGLPMLIAEELEADWSQVRIEPADANLIHGTTITVGSTSTADYQQRLRIVGAQAREMLLQAAADQWRVPVADCVAREGAVSHAASGRKLSYGALAQRASTLTPPKAPALKDPKDWKLLGKEVLRRDAPAKIDGTAIFGIDVRIPGMLTGAIRVCPAVRGKLVSVDETPALAIHGVHSVVKFPDAFIVLADHFWIAEQAAKALDPKWDLGTFGTESSATLDATRRRLLDTPGLGVVRRGFPMTALRGAKQIEAIYEVPYLPHNCMEPVNATVRVDSNGAEAWLPTQGPVLCQMTIARVLGMKPEQVRVHPQFLGGSFGRKAGVDYVIYATLASKISGRPVKVIYSREQDVRNDPFRPKALARMQAMIDAHGRVIAMDIKMVAQSISAALGPPFKDSLGGVDFFTTAGLPNVRYDIPTLNIEYVEQKVGLKVGSLRSVGEGATGFFVESFIDEIAHTLGRDPLELRRELLADSNRYLGVLDRVAAEAGWGKPLPPGHFQGLAVFEYHGTLVAEIAEVSVPEPNSIRVHRITAAVDCGRVLNPSAGRAQVEGSIAFALSDSLFGEITVKDGVVEQSNFHQIRMLRLHEAPHVDVHFVESTAPISGLGEPAVPPLAPAVANAVFRATGNRIRTLPFIGKKT